MLFYAGRKQTQISECGILLITVPFQRLKETDTVIRVVKKDHILIKTLYCPTDAQIYNS